jgi:hypothetical protein
MAILTRYVGLVATKGIFSSKGDFPLKALLNYYEEKERTNLTLFYSYTILTGIQK